MSVRGQFVRGAVALLLGVAVVPVVASAQAAKAGEHEHGEKHAPSPWKELDQYHTLMAAVWHPARDKSDMAPARQKAGELAAAGRALAASTPPKGCDAPAYLPKVKGLSAESDKVAGMVVAKAGDVELKAAVKALHDSFHGVEEGCAAGKEKKHGGH
jgi:hypothetical protein